MAVQSIGPTASSAFTGTSNAQSAGLGQADFLTLLMKQMQNQDPLSPVSGTDFVAQLAQFSSLQSAQQLNSNINQMLVLQQVTQGASLIGKQITFASDGRTLTTRGTVDSVQVNNGAVQLMVGNQPVALSQVRTISAGSTSR